MAEEKSLSFAEVQGHSSKNDLYMIVHDRVYNATSFVDEHPGGEEVLIDVGGQDATEAFEDVGHSDEAREILEKLFIGTLERKEGDPQPTTATTSHASVKTSGDSGSGSVAMYALVFLGVIGAVIAYQMTQAQDRK